MEASPIEFKLSAADLVILDHGCFYVYVVLSARRQGVYAGLSVAAGVPEEPAKCPQCRRDVTEKTLVEVQGE